MTDVFFLALDSCRITYVLVFVFSFFTKMDMARAHTPTCACLCVSGTGIMLHTRLEQRSLQAAYFHLHTCPLAHVHFHTKSLIKNGSRLVF